MVWPPPTAAKNVLTPRVIPDNLLAYFAHPGRQADALTWAGGTGYKLIKSFSNSVANRTIPVFPSIAFSDDNDKQEIGDDTIPGGYIFTLEVSIQNASPDTAVIQARVYAKALCSMTVNCPGATLEANTGAVPGTTMVQSIETNFDPIKTNEMQNDFLQQFQIQVGVSLIGKAYI